MDKTKSRLGFLDRIFPVLVLLTMAVGLLIGKAVPQIGLMLELFIPLGLFLMIYPTVTKAKIDTQSILKNIPELLWLTD